MKAASFITFFTYTLRHNGISFYKGSHATFKQAQEKKRKQTIYSSSYSPLNEGQSSILTYAQCFEHTE